jgi:hypothetical protein
MLKAGRRKRSCEPSGPVASSCEHCNEPSNYRYSLDKLNDCQPFMKVSASWTWVSYFLRKQLFVILAGLRNVDLNVR